MSKRSLIYLIVGIVSLLVYINALENEFVFDDESVVQNNLSITTLSNIPKFFTNEEGFSKVIGKYYRPLVSTSYSIDYAIWGMKPFGFHLTNIIIHILATLLLLAILLKLFEKYKYGILAAQIAALIFAVHPIHTEAVSWISGRTDSLVTLFFFWAFYAYLKYIDNEDNKNNKWLIWCCVAYILGLISKEMIVTFPFVIILFDYIYRKKEFNYLKKNGKAYLLLIAITLVFLLIRYLLLKDVPDRITYNYFYGKDLGTAIFTMLKTIPVYFKLLFVPINLLYHYNGVLSYSSSITDIKVILSVIFLLALITAGVYTYKNHNKISFSIFFFLLSLLPVMNIIPTMNFMAERFLYITSFALSIVVGVIIVKYFNESRRNIILTVSVLVIILLGFLTYERNKDWKDNNTLYMTADNIDGSVLLINAGNVYANSKRFDEAEIRYRRAIEIKNESVLAHHNLGLIYLLKDNLDSAEIQFKKGIEIDTLAPDGYFQLGNLYQRQGRYDGAITMFEKLQIVSPDYRDSRKTLELLKSNANEPEKLKENIATIQILQKRSFELYQKGKFSESIKDLEQLISIDAANGSGYYNNMALCYIALNDKTKSKESFEKSINADAGNTRSLSGLADMYAADNNHKKAIDLYNKILQIEPTNSYALNKKDSLEKIIK